MVENNENKQESPIAENKRDAFSISCGLIAWLLIFLFLFSIIRSIIYRNVYFVQAALVIDYAVRKENNTCEVPTILSEDLYAGAIIEAYDRGGNKISENKLGKLKILPYGNDSPQKKPNLGSCYYPFSLKLKKDSNRSLNYLKLTTNGKVWDRFKLQEDDKLGYFFYYPQADYIEGITEDDLQ